MGFSKNFSPTIIFPNLQTTLLVQETKILDICEGACHYDAQKSNTWHIGTLFVINV